MELRILGRDEQHGVDVPGAGGGGVSEMAPKGIQEPARLYEEMSEQGARRSE